MWEVKVRAITEILPHPNADKLELAMIGGWQCVVRKGEFKVSDLVIYYPTDTIIPQKVLGDLGLIGKLSGPEKNRVKAVRLRGQYSIGIIQANSEGFLENSDVAEHYGCTKWEPPIPLELRGKIISRPRSYMKYDVNSFNDAINLFSTSDNIILLEKAHGCHMEVGIVNGELKVCSRNLCLEESDSNLYWRMARKYNLQNLLLELHSSFGYSPDTDLWLHMEILCTQDLKYGLTEPELRIFDVRRWENGLHYWFSYDEMLNVSCFLNVPSMPLLYEGPFSIDVVKQHSQGMEQISEKQIHIREGCVVKLPSEKYPTKGVSDRMILKCINPEYLIRDNGTEFH